MSMRWYDDFAAELAAVGIPGHEAADLVAASRAEAEAGGTAPGALYGPAVPYARALAAAARSQTPARSRSLPAGPSETVLRMSAVHVRRGRREVLRGVDLHVRRGETVAVVGANGSGKSTLLQVCAGLIPASAGQVHRSRRFGYVPQEDGLAGLLTVKEHLRLVGAARGLPAGKAVSTGLAIMSGLGWRADGRERVDRLSGGTRQKLNVALAQLDSPDLLLLDEPYQGFDATAYDDLWELIAAWCRSGAGVLVVTHHLHDLHLADRVVELPGPPEPAP